MKTRQEAEQNATTGGALHARKSLFKKTERMKKPLIAMGMTGALLFSVAGCSGALDTPDKNNVPDQLPQTTASCSTEDPGPWGDVIAKETVTDEFGEYCQTTIDPESAAFKYDASKVDVASLQEHGFTEEDAKEVQQRAAQYLSEVALDSSILDNYAGAAQQEWFEKNKSYYSESIHKIGSEMIATQPIASTGLVVSNYVPSPLKRDGSPRADYTNIQLYSISAQSNETYGPYIQAIFSVSSVYSVKEKSIVDSIVKNNASITESQLQTTNPELFDGSEDNQVLLNGNFGFAYSGKDLSTIVGANADWNVQSDSGAVVYTD